MGRSNGRTDSPRKKGWQVALATGIVLQLLVLFYTFAVGEGYSEWCLITAVGQAIVGLVVVVWVGWRRPARTLLVPLVSVFLSFGLLFVAPSRYASSRACTSVEESALRELTPPDAVLGNLDGGDYGCSARVTTSRPADEVRAQYDQEFVDHGWEKVTSDDPNGTSAVRDGFRVDVHPVPKIGVVFVDLSPR